jgi:hypothetical protein
MLYHNTTRPAEQLATLSAGAGALDMAVVFPSVAACHSLAPYDTIGSRQCAQGEDNGCCGPQVGRVGAGRNVAGDPQRFYGITRYRASIAILDITGVPVVDTHVVQSILQAARAASLLGAVCILSGIRPEVAQTIVSLAMNLGDTPVSANLQEGIRLASSQLS